MGNVFKINSYLQFLNSNGNIGLTILNNMEKSEYISENLFDKIYYKSITDINENIKKDIADFLKRD